MIFQVVDIMRVNVEKVLERDQKLSELDNRAGRQCFYIYIINYTGYGTFSLYTV